MKTRKKCWIIEKRGKTLLSVLAGMSLALGTASAAGPATCQQPANPFERGAARLMDRTPPECLPSETNNPVLRPLVEKWKHLPLESRRCPTIRSNHTVNLAVHIIRKAPGRPVLVCLAEDILGVVEAVDIVLWPCAMDFKKHDVEIMADKSIVATLINGAIRTSEQEEMAHLLRRKSQFIIA